MVSAASIFARSVSELALLRDGSEYGGATIRQLLQVRGPLLEHAQLQVIETARRFLAVARHERHSCAFVEQRERGACLARRHVQLARYTVDEFIIQHAEISRRDAAASILDNR